MDMGRVLSAASASLIAQAPRTVHDGALPLDGSADSPTLPPVPFHGTHTVMIRSFRDTWLESWYVEEKHERRVPPEIADHLFRKLQLIEDATTDADLRAPPSNHFEKLRGALDGYHSIRVNQRWRLIFRWDGSKGEATGLYLDDHSYR
jgi:toxin HigB-1